MYEWIRRIHNYCGLFALTAICVWGITGIHAIFLPAPGNWVPPDVSKEWEVPYEAPGDLDDETLRMEVFKASGVKMSPPPFRSSRDENHNLFFNLYTPSGRRDVTYLETEKKIRVEFLGNDIAGFLSAMHAGSSRRGPPDFPARVWGYYNEFANWAFFFMTLSGVYLWLATRPKLLWAGATFGGSVIVFIALWFLTR